MNLLNTKSNLFYEMKLRMNSLVMNKKYLDMITHI